VTSFAVVPAAGKSTRMGRPKLALLYQGHTVLEAVIAALIAGGVENVLVVLGPHVCDLVEATHRAGARALVLANETPDMRATVAEGLRELTRAFHPRPDAVWFLAPADHPTLRPEVVRTLLAAARDDKAFSAAIPIYQGKRGHPTLLSWQHAERLETFSPTQGINAYLRQLGDALREVPVEHAEILCDLDTPEDYARLTS
jgi:molybdenum cofactor cytidylyltransferase